MAIDVDPIAREDEARGVVLEGYGIVVRGVSPVVDVWAEGPGSSPVNGDVADDRIEFGGNVVVFSFGEDDFAVVAAGLKGVQDVGDVAGVASIGVDCALFSGG